jgi:hypothetical protein
MKPLRHPKLIALLGALVASSSIAATSATTAHAATCPPPPTTSQVFKAWGDTNDYAALPGGSFESTLSGWQLNGGNQSNGNEPAYVHSKSDSHSFTLNQGDVVTTSAICEPQLQPMLRLFVKNTGASSGMLHVQFLVNQNNTLSVLDGGYWTFDNAWSLSPTIVGLWSGPLSGALQVRLTAVGSGASFQVDDLYVDPCLSR